MARMNPATSDPEQSVWDERCALLFKVWVQLRYHRRRQRFFDMADKGTKSLTVLLGATLIGQALRGWLPYVASAISGLALLALVFAYTDRKQAHKELAELAAGLIGDIEAVPAGELTAARVAAWRAAHARHIAKAPPPLKALTLICEREQATADGHPDHVPPVGWPRRWVADFF